VANRPGNPQDNTGRLHISRLGSPNPDQPDVLHKLGHFHIDPAWTVCAKCEGEEWRVLSDQQAPTFQMQCVRCKTVSAPFELHKLQVNEALARKYPRTFVPLRGEASIPLLDTEIDIER
jgi:hypothetical protein